MKSVEMIRNNILTCSFLLRMFLLFALGFFILSNGGCGGSKPKSFGGDIGSKTGSISKSQLRSDLAAFEELFRATVKETCDQVDSIDSTSKTRKMNLILKTKASQAINTMFEQKDEVVAYLDTWVFVMRFHYYFSEGNGSSLFGDNQYLYVEMGQGLQEDIEAIGKKFVEDEKFEEVRQEVSVFARSTPIKVAFSNTIVYATRSEPGKPSPFEEVVQIPLVPITAMKGVDRTATSINTFSNTASHFSNIVEELPESTRWQLLGLFYDIEEIEGVKSFQARLSELSKSSEEIAKSAKDMPRDIREQMSILISEVDDKQGNIQLTLDKLKDVMATVDQASSSLKTTAVDITQVAIAWEEAANSTTKILEELNKGRSAGDGSKQMPDYTIKDIQNIVDTMNKTVIEIGKLVESKKLGDYATVPQEFVDNLTWRCTQLISLIFMFAVIYKIVARCLVCKKK